MNSLNAYWLIHTIKTQLEKEGEKKNHCMIQAFQTKMSFVVCFGYHGRLPRATSQVCLPVSSSFESPCGYPAKDAKNKKNEDRFSNWWSHDVALSNQHLIIAIFMLFLWFTGVKNKRKSTIFIAFFPPHHHYQ